MDIAYDHITEETFSPDRASTPTPQKSGAPSSSKPNLNTEFQETFRAFSNSPWGARLGGLWGNVRKQGEQYYEGARREVEGASEEALKGFSDLRETIVKQTHSLSLEKMDREGAEAGVESRQTTSTHPDGENESPNKKRTESEVIRENESLVARFRTEAAKRLKDIEKAEDAADEALLRFGTNIRNFLRDAVAVAPPSEDGTETKSGTSVLFESKDPGGKRVIHTTRFDAQLHVMHSTLDSFLKDPVSDEWPNFKQDFKTDQKTGDISRDLEKYPDLRRAMERLVPEKVDYKDFWCRYYFLRLVIETEERRRRELLRGVYMTRSSCTTQADLYDTGASQNEQDDEITWDADSDEEEQETSSTHLPTDHKITLSSNEDTGSTTTLSQEPQPAPAPTINKPAEGRRSNDRHSQPDSDASYDLVSGVTSRNPGSPKEDKDKEKEKIVKKDEESDGEDWE
jgi:BSD domain